MAAEFLKNPKTGVVFAKTAVLSKRADLVPCDKDGRLVLPDQMTVEPHELMLNPVNGTVIKWTEQLAGVRGLIGVDNDAQAIATMEQLERVASSTANVAHVPIPGGDAEVPADTHEEQEHPQAQADEHSGALELPPEANDWNSMQLKAWAQENLDEVLDGRLSPNALRDQIQIALNNHNQEVA